MTQRAAIDLAIRLEVLATGDHDPAVHAGSPYVVGDPLDADAVAAFGRNVDVVTLDHELVSADGLRRILAGGIPVVPNPDALRFAQDKLFARTQLAARDVPVPTFAEVATVADVEAFASDHGWPVVLKLSTMGYDGRGVEVVADADAAAVLERPGTWVAEEYLDLAMELAVLVARRPSGDMAVYPVVETVQEHGMCRELVMPARAPAGIVGDAVELARDVVAEIDAAGIVAVELFVTADQRLLVNELAMRPHNSGHATIEGSVTSQFHNHLRAVLDWPLGSTELIAPAVAMVNLLGSGFDAAAMRNLPRALAVDGAAIHLYAKEERMGRKIGHVTALGSSAEDALAVARRAATILGEAS
jgi:5-(carboxyamino)imidazole ribonucleotide synthase